MSEEKKLILKMLKEGKITEDEAIQLLDSINDNSAKSGADRYAQFESNFINKIVSAVDKIGKKSQEVINNFDIDDFTIPFEGMANKSKVDKVVTENISDVEHPSLVVENVNGKISIVSWDNDEIEARAKVSYDEKLISMNYDFVTLNRDGETFTVKPNYTEQNSKHFDMSIVVMLPKKTYESLKVSTTNSSIDVGAVETNNLEISSTNGRIYLKDIKAEDAGVNTTNAKISITSIAGNSLKIETTNGKIELIDLGSKFVELVTTNGGLALSKLRSEVENIKASTHNGNVVINLDGIFKPVKARLVDMQKSIGNTNITNKIFTNSVNVDGDTIMYSDGYNDEGEHLYIEATTSNGTININ